MGLTGAGGDVSDLSDGKFGVFMLNASATYPKKELPNTLDLGLFSPKPAMDMKSSDIFKQIKKNNHTLSNQAPNSVCIRGCDRFRNHRSTGNLVPSFRCSYTVSITQPDTITNHFPVVINGSHKPCSSRVLEFTICSSGCQLPK